MTCGRVSVVAAILPSTSSKHVVGSFSLLLPFFALCLCVSVSHAAAVHVVSLCSGMRQLELWHGAMIRLRFLLPSFVVGSGIQGESKKGYFSK